LRLINNSRRSRNRLNYFRAIKRVFLSAHEESRCANVSAVVIDAAKQDRGFRVAVVDISAVRPVHCAGSELVVLVFEQNVERGKRSVTARDVLLQVELVRFAQFVARVHLLLENSQIVPDHDDFVEECLEPATAGKLISTEANVPQAA
jgi:hypothetical protein